MTSIILGAATGLDGPPPAYFPYAISRPRGVLAAAVLHPGRRSRRPGRDSVAVVRKEPWHARELSDDRAPGRRHAPVGGVRERVAGCDAHSRHIAVRRGEPDTIHGHQQRRHLA